jgi:hypothetical protein
VMERALWVFVVDDPWRPACGKTQTLLRAIETCKRALKPSSGVDGCEESEVSERQQGSSDSRRGIRAPPVARTPTVQANPQNLN